MIHDLKKHARIRVRRTDARLVPLAGAQMKVGLDVTEFTGVVAHLRGDHPTAPTRIMLYVDPDEPDGMDRVVPHGCAHPGGHVEVDPKHVVEVIG